MVNAVGKLMISHVYSRGYVTYSLYSSSFDLSELCLALIYLRYAVVCSFVRIMSCILIN